MISRHALNSVFKFSRQGCGAYSFHQGSTSLTNKLNLLKGNRFIHVSSIYCAEPQRRKRRIPKIFKPKELKELKVWKNITVEEVALALDFNYDDMELILPGIDFNPETEIETPEMLAKPIQKFGWKLKIIKNPNASSAKSENPLLVRQPPPKPENLVKRPPVVTVMGHVDHGKTTLLDSLRNTFVVEQEFGGITQHIGAFSVEVKSGEKITFIDTPGHAAFTAMRSRGAEATDLVVLVIAADDGVMEQTVESINIIKRAGVPLIVAVNKIDKVNAMDINLIKEKLLVEGVQVEDKGGDVQLVPISALKKINLDLLTEVILLEAEVMNLKGDPTGLVEGVIIESKLDKRGLVATVIVKRGTLTRGKVIVAGTAHARVRSMVDENGVEYKTATPSTPVQIFGWKDLPSAGDEVFEVPSEKDATKITREREREILNKKQEGDLDVIKARAAKDKKKHFEEKVLLETAPTFYEKKKRYFELRQSENPKVVDTKPRLNLILKGDVFGSLEVLLQVLDTYKQHDECELSVVSSSVGSVTIKDLEMAECFDGVFPVLVRQTETIALIYAFNVNVLKEIEVLVKEKNVDIHFHNVLYKLIDDLKEELTARILPKDGEKVIGEAEVLQHFNINEGRKKIPVAGCKCTKGELKRGSLYRIQREDEVIHEGTLVSMKHHKNEVNTVQRGTDCGLMFKDFVGKFSTGDVIVCYEKIKVPQKTSWNPGF